MDNRMTRKLDEYPCRIIDCYAEEWMTEVTGIDFYNWKSDKNPCDNCPFEKYINRLGEVEDMIERIEDDEK